MLKGREDAYALQSLRETERRSVTYFARSALGVRCILDRFQCAGTNSKQMKKQSTKVFTLGHSPDPDDAFMFYAIAENKIDLRGYRFEHQMEDIQTLNERARRGELHISAISIHAYAYVTGRYALLPCGASMGDGYGPILVRNRGIGDLANRRNPKATACSPPDIDSVTREF